MPALCAGVALGQPQAEPAAQQPGSGATARSVGTVQSIAGNTVTLKPDTGAEVVVQVQDSTRLVRVAPGQKDLKGATVIGLPDLQVGDRVLVRGAASADGKALTAASIVVMKQTDIAAQRRQEQEDWQKRGVGGLVSAVDPAAGTVTISIMAGSAAKKVTIRVSKATVLRRYAPDSVRFADAKPGALDEIKAGDQLRARGVRSADGGEMTAEEIVSGRFLNVAGTVLSIDASAGQFSVMDLATKSAILVKVTADSQLRKLPPMLAQMIAARLKGGQPQPGASGTPAAGGSRQPGGERPSGAEGAGSAAGGPGARYGGGAAGSADLQQVLSHLPSITLADLQKGEAVMMVTTQKGATPSVTAITLLSGVEPILTGSPSGGGSALLSAWSLSAPAGDGAGQ
ncbi:MAG TPA: DUF5666 domain-containing protein [Terriglobia bacterium]|nr:DUF5666 domain-containing protein [Terriglobia bacterium]